MTTKEALNSNIPAEAVEQREAWRGGPKLSYLTGAYVLNRLNEVLGQGNWSYGIHNMNKVFEGEIEQSSGKAFTVSYITQVWFNATIDGRTVNFVEVGYGDGTDKKSQGKAHELATKESVTDGLKRAAKNLGISLGLGLYFKSGEYVDETPKTNSQVTAAAVKAAATAKPQPTKSTSQTAAAKETTTPTVLPSDSAKPFTDTKIARTKIKQSLGVLEAQKKITKKDFAINYLGSDKSKVEKLHAEALSSAVDKKISSITDEQVLNTLALITKNFGEKLDKKLEVNN